MATITKTKAAARPMPKLIKSEAEHRAVIGRISALMEGDPAPGTPAGDELELLAHLAAAYEKEHYSIGLPDPVSAIRFCMEQQGVSRNDLVPLLGSRSRVSEILGRKRALTVAMIRKLHSQLGIPTEVLVGKGEAEPRQSAELMKKFPFKEMFKRGWFQFVGTLAEAKKVGDDLLEKFCCFGWEGDALPALNRQNVRPGSTEDAFALLAWKTRVLCRAKAKNFTKPFEAASLDWGACKHLVALSVHGDGPALAIEYLENLGVALVIEPHLPGTHLDGAAMRLPDDGRPVIALTLRYDRVDHFWFCLLHELGHVLRHILTGQVEYILDDLSEKSSVLKEREADEFALELGISKTEWQRIWKNGGFTSDLVRAEAKRLVIHPAILAGRIRKALNKYTLLGDCVGQGEVRALFPAEFGRVKARSKRASRRRHNGAASGRQGGRRESSASGRRRA